MPKMVIAVVNGLAPGAAFSIAAACDLALASTQAQFTLAYTRIGLCPDGGATYTLPQLSGRRTALELTLTNRTLDAAEALRLGIVNAVWSPEQLSARARELAAQLADGPSEAFAEVKRLVRQPRIDLEAQLEDERQAILRLVETEEFSRRVEGLLRSR